MSSCPPLSVKLVCKMKHLILKTFHPSPSSPLRVNFAALLVPGHLSTALPGSIGTNIILSNLPSVIHVHAGAHLSHRLVQVIIAVIFHLVAANV